MDSTTVFITSGSSVCVLISCHLKWKNITATVSENVLPNSKSTFIQTSQKQILGDICIQCSTDTNPRTDIGILVAFKAHFSHSKPDTQTSCSSIRHIVHTWLVHNPFLIFFVFHSNWFSPESHAEWGIGHCHLFLTSFTPLSDPSLPALYVKSSCSKLISQVSSLPGRWLPRSLSALQYV